MRSDMIERIGRALERAGLAGVPADIHAPLADHGMDSLLMVLSVAELEREFSVTIGTDLFSEAAFDTLAAVQALLRRAGAE
jgi:acyl carrier protein